jgi:hypothetical protein
MCEGVWQRGKSAIVRGDAMSLREVIETTVSELDSETSSEGVETFRNGENRAGARRDRQLHETAVHRRIAMLKVEGFSNREIAEQIGWSDDSVSKTTNQPWFQDMMIREFRTEGRQVAEDLIRLEVLPSIRRLVEIRDDPDTKASVKATVAMNLIDRFLGKPTQRVESVNMNANVNLENVADIEQRQREVQSELDRLLNPNKTT